tara:strand:+ start:625 stop:1272 length:648 start_codon:yes stop_codon:yes gene_type:complete
MKKIFLCLSLALITYNSNAQDFSWGPKISLTSPSLNLSDVNEIQTVSETIDLLEDTDATIGYQFGLFARASLLGVYIQPEVLLSNSNSEIKYNDLSDSENPMEIVGEVRLNKLEIPVLIGKRFFKVLRVNAGPIFTLLINEDITQSSDYEKIESNYKDTTVGAQIGAGLDLAILTVDLRYEMGLQSITDGITIGENTFNADQRLNQFLLSVGIKF